MGGHRRYARVKQGLRRGHRRTHRDGGNTPHTGIRKSRRDTKEDGQSYKDPGVCSGSRERPWERQWGKAAMRETR